MARHLPIDESARVLGISRRTVERRVKAGTLSATHDAGRKLISVPDEVIDATGAPVTGDRGDVSATRQARHDRGDSDATRAALEAELLALRSERDWLRQHVEHLAVLNAQLTATVQRALPPGPVEGTPGPVTDQPAPARPAPRPAPGGTSGGARPSG